MSRRREGAGHARRDCTPHRREGSVGDARRCREPGLHSRVREGTAEHALSSGCPGQQRRPQFTHRRQSADGIELTLATNVLGYHLLTHELLEILKASAPARIVNVASTYAGNLDIDDLQFTRRPYNPVKAYQQSKACNRLLTWALARRLAGSGVTANAMAPGLVQTGLYRRGRQCQCGCCSG